MSNVDYQQVAELEIMRISDALEDADARGDIELESDSSMVSIVSDSGKTWLISTHNPSEQLWLSSPVTGGLHFSYDAGVQNWVLADGRVLDTLLKEELRTYAHVEMP